MRGPAVFARPMTLVDDQPRVVGARRASALRRAGSLRVQPARVRARAARAVLEPLRRRSERGAAARHESGAVRNGADRRAVRRRHDGARLARDRRSRRQAAARAPEAAGARLRLRPRGGQRHAALGMGARSVRHAGAVLRAILRRELLPARVHGVERRQSHARQAAAQPSSKRSSARATRRCAASCSCCGRGSSSGLVASPSAARAPRWPAKT